MTNNFFIFLKVLAFTLGIILILLASSMPLGIVLNSAVSGLHGIDVVGLILSICAIFGSVYVLYKIFKTKSREYVVFSIVGILVYVFLLAGYGLNYESLWRLEALLRGIELLPR